MIKTFLILANNMSFTKTANQMFVAQSTVTNRITELERELKTTLFYRTNRTVKLTPEGEIYKEYAEKIISLTEKSLAEMSSVKKYKNNLRIGSTDSIYEGHLASLILKYKKNNPDNSLRISIGLSNHLIEQLQGDFLDVVFSYIPLRKLSYHSELYKQDSLVLVTDRNNKKYAKGITAEKLTEINYLMCNFALRDVGQFIRNLFPRFHQFELEIDDCMKIVPYLVGQNNYTFLPKHMAETYIGEKKLREIPLLDFSTPVINSYIIYKDSMKERVSEVF
nr:LysR family transcriptional regulator [Eubacterium ruminantium]